MSDPNRLFPKNLVITKINLLKEHFPEIFQGDLINWEVFDNYLKKLTVGKNFYHFGWRGRRRAIDAIFSPPTGNFQFCPEKSLKSDETQNIFIEGDNLTSLKLLYEDFHGKIDIIYIDPPYNTGKNFVYNDDFTLSKTEYHSQTADDSNVLEKKLILNSDSGGRFHSTWMTMMYPRLFLSREFLISEGIMIVSIDDHEYHNLRRMMDEIFGQENFLGTIIWNSTKSVTNTALISVSHTYNLVYCKNKVKYLESAIKFFPNFLADKNNLNGNSDENMQYYSRLTKNPLNSLWDDLETTTNATEALKQLLGGRIFDNPKPVSLIQHFIQRASSNRNAMILDFFAGSGTTAEAVLRLNAQDGGNRSYILVQIPEKTPEKSLAYKNGFKNIAEITYRRVTRVIQNIERDIFNNPRQKKKMNFGLKYWSIAP